MQQQQPPRQTALSQLSLPTALTTQYTNPNLLALLTEQINQLPYPPQIHSYASFVDLEFTVPKSGDGYSFKIREEGIVFHLVLGRGMPYIAPRLFIATYTGGVGFNDCRNLLAQVLGRDWGYEVRLRHVQEGIIDFLKRVNKLPNNIYAISRLGQFPLNTLYPTPLLKKIRPHELFYSFQYKLDNSLVMYLVDISSTHITFFKTKQQPIYENGTLKIPSQSDITNCMLVFCAQLGSIAQILVNRPSFKDVEIKFVSRKIGSGSHTVGNVSVVKKIKCRKGQQFLKKLMHEIKNYPMQDMKIQPNPQLIQKQQKALLNQVNIAQKQLLHRFNQKTVQDLSECYRKIIQYYSGTNLPYYDIFADKLTRLYQRPDVRLIIGAEQGEGREQNNKLQQKEVQKQQQFKVNDKQKKNQTQKLQQNQQIPLKQKTIQQNKQEIEQNNQNKEQKEKEKKVDNNLKQNS